MLQLYITKIYPSTKYIFSVVTSHIIVIADCDDNIFLKTPQGSEEQQRNWKLEFQNVFTPEHEEWHMTRVGSKYHLNIWQMQKTNSNISTPRGIPRIKLMQKEKLKYNKLTWKNVTISVIWFQEVTVMLEEKIENAWMSKPAWAGEKACPFWNSRRRWYHFSKRKTIWCLF